jgi:hypothetical protein
MKKKLQNSSLAIVLSFDTLYTTYEILAVSLMDTKYGTEKGLGKSK